MAHLLGAEGLFLEYPDGVVLDGVTIGIDEGDRIGIVGRNGAGKTSLMALLAGRRQPDGGRVTTRRGVHIGMLSQQDELPTDWTVGHAVVGDRPDHEWAGDARVRDVINGLLGGIDWHARLSDLSGGQRRRVSLAGLLIGDHDVLFLDEPTNHLDVEGVVWLAGHIKSRWAKGSGAFIVVTHDRWFLDEVCETTWEVHDRIVEPFEGGYAAYVLQRVERDRQAASSERKRQNLMRKELAWLRRGPPARTSKPKFRIDAATKLIAEEPPARDTVALQQLAVTRLGKEVIDIEGASVSYGETPVLRDITWRIAPGERAAIMGVNGAGKSTLVGLVTGDVQPTEGRVKRGSTVKVASLGQHTPEVAAGKRIRELMAERKASFKVGSKEMSASQMLEQLGFDNSHMSAFVGELSGGQRRRLQLLMQLLDEPNVLVLDEPTNDLDTDMLAAMEDLLDTWPGTLIVVSHDRYFVERVTDVQYAVVDGRFVHLPGGVEQYVRLRSGSGGDGDAAVFGKEGAGGSKRLDNITERQLRKEQESIERKLQKVPGQIETAEAKLHKHDQSDYVGLGELMDILNGLKTKRDGLELRWLEISEALDQ